MDSFIPKLVREKDIYDLIRKLSAGGEQGSGPTPGSEGGEMPPSKIFDREGLLERLGGFTVALLSIRPSHQTKISHEQ